MAWVVLTCNGGGKTMAWVVLYSIIFKFLLSLTL
jgi:hypothetical protein